MKWIAVVTRLVVAASMVVLAHQPKKAGAAGVYENAAAEPAFLMSERRTSIRADLDFSRNDPVEASIYRVGAAFPLRNVFMLAVEQTFDSRSDSSSIEGGVGDFMVRASARAWHGDGWSLSFLGYLAAGTTKQDLFKAHYRGVRVSFGYPACPRLEDQEQLFRLLDVEKSIGVQLTEGFMMEPEGSVSALVFHHPEARYFSLTEQDAEQLERSVRAAEGAVVA